MNKKLKPGLAVGTVLLLALGGGTAAVARDGGGGGGKAAPPLDREALLEEAASRLGVEPAELRRALLGALGEELDNAVAVGRLTERQAERIRERAQAGAGLPFFGPQRGPGRVHGPRVHLLDAAASHLGIPASALRAELRAGRTLAEVAEAEGESTDALREALLERARERVQEHVQAGRLSQARADLLLRRLGARIDALVDGRFGRARQWGGRGHGG